MGNNLFKYKGITVILTAFDGGIIIHLYNIGISIRIFYINSIESPADCIRSLNTEPDDLLGDIIPGNTFNPAVDQMPIDRCLDFERIGWYTCRHRAVSHPAHRPASHTCS